MEVRVTDPSGRSVPVAVTMRTPGDDFALAAGLLVSEGVVEAGTIVRVAYCDDVARERLFNVVTVKTSAPAVIGEARRVAPTSACGICGAASLDEVQERCGPPADGPVVEGRALIAMPAVMRAGQRIFERTGGLHAAALFDPAGGLMRVSEDIGRHNAVDKIVGAAALAGELPLAGRVLVVSGRVGFEIVQKAAVAGIAVIASVSAPSSLAADAAERFGITLVGFLRDDGYNVYTAPERIRS